MKLPQVIREKRKQLNLTQEQVARYLGVTAPAVNKWEKGISYPDITLLPPLARLLGTDLNTLLAFHENLTDQEVEQFAAELSAMAMTEDFAVCYQTAMEKIAQYPTCVKLLYYAAVTLEAALIRLPEKDERQRCREEIEKLYLRAAQGDDFEISHQAKLMLAGRYIERKELEQAEALLDELPELPVDTVHLRASLYIAQGKLDKAGELMELAVAKAGQELESHFLMLIEIAAEERDEQRLEELIGLSQKTAKLYDLWGIFPCLTEFRIAAVLEDKDRCIKALKNLLAAMKQPWKINQSSLYKHIQDEAGSYALTEQMAASFAAGLKNDPTVAFLRKDPEFLGLIKAFEMDVKEEKL